MKRFFLFCLLTGATLCSFGQPVAYGNNPQAGHYYDTGSAKLYYEIYGAGKPVVLLHGGVYGYIDEFEPFIKRLAETNRVICIATRGHGKSEIGHAPFTYAQRSDDAYKIIRSLTKDSVTVIGFSDGGYSGLTLAALHPELVKKLVAIGAGDHRPAGRRSHKIQLHTRKPDGPGLGFFCGASLPNARAGALARSTADVQQTLQRRNGQHRNVLKNSMPGFGNERRQGRLPVIGIGGGLCKGDSPCTTLRDTGLRPRCLFLQFSGGVGSGASLFKKRLTGR